MLSLPHRTSGTWLSTPLACARARLRSTSAKYTLQTPPWVWIHLARLLLVVFALRDHRRRTSVGKTPPHDGIALELRSGAALWRG